MSIAAVIVLCTVAICGTLVFCMWHPKIAISPVDNWRLWPRFVGLWPVFASIALAFIDYFSANKTVIESLPQLYPITHSDWYPLLIGCVLATSPFLRNVKQTHVASPDLVGPLPTVEPGKPGEPPK